MSIEACYKALKTFKETECSCKLCKSMCSRPCFGTPEDIQGLIDLGYGDRLCLDWHCGLNDHAKIFIITPALKGSEGKKAPAVPTSVSGCTFLNYGKCSIHNSGHKPLGPKLAYHAQPSTEYRRSSGDYIAETWNSDKGRALVEKWCAERNLDVSETMPTLGDALKIVQNGVLNGTCTPEDGFKYVRDLTENLLKKLDERLKE